MHVYVTQVNFTTKPRFEIKNKRSFTEMNSQGSRVEKNTHAQKVQMQNILFTNEACWWNLLVWRNHAYGLFSLDVVVTIVFWANFMNEQTQNNRQRSRSLKIFIQSPKI